MRSGDPAGRCCRKQRGQGEEECAAIAAAAVAAIVATRY